MEGISMAHCYLINLKSPEETWTDEGAALLWEKLENAKEYIIYENHTAVGRTCYTDYTFTGWEHNQTYEVSIAAVMEDDKTLKSNVVSKSTKPLPEIFDISEYGAVGDGRTLNTKAIQSAIDHCTPGGKVLVPKGIFVTGALYLKSDITLYIEEEGKLLGSDNLEDFPILQYRFEGLETECYASLINTNEAVRLNNIIIAGRGVIDANGSLLRKKELIEKKGKPGRAICLRNVDRVYLQDITVRQSPAWCVHTIYCNHVSLNHVEIHTKYDEHGNKYEGMENGDGFDPDSCSYVNVFNSMIASEDDCIAIKSGRDKEGREVGIPAEYIRVTNCRFKSGFGVAVGSEMAGSVRNVLVQDCTFENVYSAVSIKAPRGRGGIIENIRYEDLTQYYHNDGHKDCKWFRGAIYIDMFYSQDAFDLITPKAVNDGTSTIRNVLMKNISVETVAGNAVYLAGLPESFLQDITFENIHGIGKYGMKAYNVKNLILKNVVVTANEEEDDILFNVSSERKVDRK
jgi:polygalacturonase